LLAKSESHEITDFVGEVAIETHQPAIFSVTAPIRFKKTYNIFNISNIYKIYNI